MSDKFVNQSGLSRFWDNIKTAFNTLLATKQDTLVSGTNVKTVDGTSLLGSGDVATHFVVHIVNNQITENYADLVDAINNGVQILISASNAIYPVVYVSKSTNSCELYYVSRATVLSEWGKFSLNSYSIASSGDATLYSSSMDFTSGYATDGLYGLVKTNSAESVTLNANGQLDIGGRLGAFSGTTGIYHSKDRAPRNVGDYSFLITDAKGMSLAAPRSFALSTGVNLTLTKSHAAGSTIYTVANNYANRIACAVLANGGYASQSEAYAKENQIVRVTSVKINGSNFTPDSSANDSSKPITITTETSANPTSATTTLRIFGGVNGGYCAEYIGQCVGGTVGASLVIGQRVYSSSNVNCIVAADVYNTGNGNAIFGRQHISRKNRSFLAGTGHDTTNARSESVSAVGQWSDITSETLFAIGDGTDHTNRSNAFEVRDQSFVIKSPDGTKWKVAVDNSGTLTTTQLAS